MQKVFVALLVAMLLVSASAMAAPIIYPFGQASTAGFVNSVFVGPAASGYQFVINQPITVVQLGINAGANIPIVMTLWDLDSQTILAQITVTSQPFAWQFANLDFPVGLLPGDSYAVIGWADTTNTGIPWYVFNNNAPPAFNPITGPVGPAGTRFENGIGINTLPGNLLDPPAMYGVADIGYTTVVPEPGTLVMLGTGVLALAGAMRRKLL